MALAVGFCSSLSDRRFPTAGRLAGRLRNSPDYRCFFGSPHYFSDTQQQAIVRLATEVE